MRSMNGAGFINEHCGGLEIPHDLFRLRVLFVQYWRLRGGDGAENNLDLIGIQKQASQSFSLSGVGFVLLFVRDDSIGLELQAATKISFIFFDILLS